VAVAMAQLALSAVVHPVIQAVVPVVWLVERMGQEH